MAHHVKEVPAARHFNVHPRTIANWIGKGFIHGYDDGQGSIYVDIDEIEHVLPDNPHMRDGRRSRYGADAKIVPLPIVRDTTSEDEK
ncbi:hypothetical protein HUN58_13800 [Curtobacterium sp. Csp1]|uniref:hypothetical protein n=1 Tax=unclassified Curtobacterium TaxID=257496 RepID=UPI00159962FC|nr:MULTISPECIES: hypothetical protein [unclassified Curtobacterium]QKS13799.1 hypothetical protein HUN60_12230 [Curtobacterium sp. csp3]QKS20843.1 hypothetical protein HUN58_13800 [Curtobacterium sp. Csp1]